VYEPASSFSASFLQNLISFSASIEGFAKEEFYNLSNSADLGVYLDLFGRAFHLTIDGNSYYCPWNTSARVQHSLSLLQENYSLPMRKLFSLPSLEQFLNSYKFEMSNKTYVITSTWLIPPRWFSLFSMEDLIEGKNSRKRFIIFRTDIESARVRCKRALSIIRKTFGPGPLVVEVEDLMTWLTTFDSKSIIELDYGGLAELLNQIEPASGRNRTETDTSVADVWESLEALDTGDGLQAGRSYQRLMNRWRGVSALEHAN
jgi:hypothetical protein